MNKPTKPSVTLPSSFGGQKENFTSSKIENGYEPDIKDILGGANLNYLLDTSGKNFEYLRTIVDFINDMPIDKTITVDSNNNLTYRDWLGGRNFGELVYSSIPLTDSSVKLLDGSILQGDGIYKNFVNHIAGLVNTYPSIFTTETNWQNIVSQYSVCGKFVYDSVNNTVRLPKITGIIEGTTDLNALGDIVQAGLPNITAQANFTDVTNDINIIQSTSGAFTMSSSVSEGGHGHIASTSGNFYIPLSFNASRSNSIYGKSSTVQPQTIKCFVYMVVANSVKKTDEELDIDEIVTDLNNKVDKSTLIEVPCIIDSYVNGTSWYRVWSDGLCEQGGIAYIPGNGGVTVYLLKPYKDINYNGTFTNQNFRISQPAGFDSKETTSFSIDYQDGNLSGNVYWEMKGYIS